MARGSAARTTPYDEISPSSMRYVEYTGARIAVPQRHVSRSLVDRSACAALPSSVPMPAICQMVAGPEAPAPGEGKNSWLTGTAAWTFVDVSQHLLGVQPTFDGLRIEPHLPAQFTELHIEREWRGVRYVIDATRTGKASLAVDGKPVSGNIWSENNQYGTPAMPMHAGRLTYGHKTSILRTAKACVTVSRLRECPNRILNRDLTDKTYKANTHDCVVASGVLQDPYTGTRIDFVRGQDTSTAVQIDHVARSCPAVRAAAQAPA